MSDGELPAFRPTSGREPVVGAGEGGKVRLTSQKHQDASVGKHGCRHPVGAGRMARGHLYGAWSEARARGSQAAADAGSPAGVLRRSCEGPAPPSALTLPAVDGCKWSRALIGPSCQKRWRQPPALRAHQRSAPSPLAPLLLPFRPLSRPPSVPCPSTPPKSSQ